MKQHTSTGRKIGGSFRYHGTLGWYAPPTGPGSSVIRSDAIHDALHTDLPVTTHSENAYSVAYTGSSERLPGGGIVVVAGRPYFRDRELSTLAQDQGTAAALAQGYSKYSQDIFTHIFGAYSCVIIDVPANRLLLGIDRLGQLPMYYHASDNRFCFGSSASGALSSAETSTVVHNQGVYNYLYFHMVPSPGSVYQGLKKIPAAHYLDYHNGQSKLVNYWCPVFLESTDKLSSDELAGQLRETLRTSVEKSLVHAGQTGSFLSGGLDSSTITGVLAELTERQSAAFSIGFSAKGYDEMAYARIAAGHFGVKLHEYYVTPQDVVEALPTIATSYDEPFGNSSALPAYFCAKMAAEHGVNTLLAGDGGDEIFGGNERYVKQRVFEHYARIPGVLRRGVIEPVVKALPAALPLASKAGSYIAQANTPLPDRLQSYNFLHRHTAEEIFADDFLTGVDRALPLELLRSIYQRPKSASDLNRMLYLDWQITLADNDLRKVSQTCALAGVDVAYPMLDDALVEFSCRVPSAWKIKGTNLRHFYKAALTGWLPQETIDKTKQGFGLPFGVWMQTYKPLRELAYDNLLKLKSRRIIRPEFVDKAIAMHQSEHAAYYGELVWIFAVFELWMEGHPDSQIH
jgi:asparagine synthase (glutamine-hydrolysing)